MLHIAVVHMHAHVLKRACIIVGGVRETHHSRLAHRLGQQWSVGRVWRNILGCSTLVCAQVKKKTKQLSFHRNI